jgi:hypothetical protein
MLGCIDWEHKHWLMRHRRPAAAAAPTAPAPHRHAATPDVSTNDSPCAGDERAVGGGARPLERGGHGHAAAL